MQKWITATGLFLALSLLVAVTPCASAADSACSGNGKKIASLASTLVAMPALLKGMFDALEQCNNFQPTDAELSDARARKKQVIASAIELQHKKVTQATCRAIFNGDCRHEVMAILIADYMLAEPKITIKAIDESSIHPTPNDYPRYRQYKYRAMMYGASALIPYVWHLYEVTKPCAFS